MIGYGENKKLMLKQYLIREFEIMELSKLKYILEIEVISSKFRIFISYLKYIHNLLRDTNKLIVKPANFPIDPNNKLGIVKEDNQ